MKPLIPDKQTELANALLKAFEPDEMEDLARQIGWTLEHIVGVANRGLAAITGDLIEWAVDHRRLERLMQVAGQRRQGDGVLATLATEAAGTVFYIDIGEDAAITREQYRQLLEILWPLVSGDDIAVEYWNGRLKALYDAVLPLGAPLYKTPNLRRIIATLSVYPLQHPNNTLPILSFVQGLLNHPELQDQAIRAALERWQQAIATTLGVPVNIAVAHSSPPLRPLSYLTVKLSPNKADSNDPKQLRYFVEVLFWSPGSTEPLRWYPDTEAEHKSSMVDEVPAILDRLFLKDSNVNQIEDTDKLVMEFVIPYNLFSYPFDSWPPAFQPDSTWGRQQPLVIRALDRMEHHHPLKRKKLRDYWVQKWGELKRSMHTRCIGKHIRWVEIAGSFNSDQFGESMRKDADALCLGYASGPPDAALFEGWQWAGAPSGIWLRTREDAGVLPLDLRAALAESPHAEQTLAMLLDWARSARISAAGDPAHFGQNLIVLWDDADRIPSKF